MEKEFDYRKAVEELESIAAKVEDPHTGIEDIGRYIDRSRELVALCRGWLRGVREEVESMD